MNLDLFVHAGFKQTVNYQKISHLTFYFIFLHSMARNSLLCVDVPLRNYSLTRLLFRVFKVSFTKLVSAVVAVEIGSAGSLFKLHLAIECK